MACRGQVARAWQRMEGSVPRTPQPLPPPSPPYPRAELLQQSCGWERKASEEGPLKPRGWGSVRILPSSPPRVGDMRSPRKAKKGAVTKARLFLQV